MTTCRVLGPIPLMVWRPPYVSPHAPEQVTFRELVAGAQARPATGRFDALGTANGGTRGDIPWGQCDPLTQKPFGTSHGDPKSVAGEACCGCLFIRVAD